MPPCLCGECLASFGCGEAALGLCGSRIAANKATVRKASIANW
jgi:hypothetical protein